MLSSVHSNRSAPRTSDALLRAARSARQLLFVALCGTIPLSANAGIVIEVWRYNLQNNARDSTITLYSQNGNLRIEQIDEEDAKTVLLFAGNDLYDIDLATNSYARIERSRIEAARRTSDPVQTLRLALLEEVPAHRRAHSLAMMETPGSLVAPDGHGEVTVGETHRYRIAPLGERCREHQVFVDGRVRYEYCLSLAPHAGAVEMMRTSEAMTDLIGDLHETLDMPWQNEAMEVYWTHAYALGGFPLIAREFEGRRPIEEFRVMQISAEDLPASTFDLPRGLRYRGVVDFGWQPGHLVDTPHDEDR